MLCCLGRRGKNPKPLASYTHTDDSQKALLLFLLVLGEDSPAFEQSLNNHQPLNSFLLWPPQNNSQGIRANK